MRSASNRLCFTEPHGGPQTEERVPVLCDCSLSLGTRAPLCSCDVCSLLLVLVLVVVVVVVVLVLFQDWMKTSTIGAHSPPSPPMTINDINQSLRVEK